MPKRLHQWFGFSLLELVIALVVIGVIASLSYPKFTHYLQRSARVEAKVALVNVSQKLAQYYFMHQSYKGANLSNLGFSNKINQAYKLELRIKDKQQYVLRAVPLDSYSRCGTLTLNQAGVRSISESKAAQTCWG